MAARTRLFLRASWAAQSKPAELQDTLQMRESHLDLFALTTRLLEDLVPAPERSEVASGSMLTTPNSAKWTLQTALCSEFVAVAIILLAG
ncbi:hypothetical protein [Bradyrhizobium sp. AUGA SZCCT0182]|uniref:hypothetical protein n=1 Tax=Bradyrhizobium sp. AUGA SZCCT0182 TaxID=2807667 RepID=UPI001BA5FF6E|nr:hypothetical protein [Bradyrhizobium sp. AUGA SZCCT0182]MBR1231860.1 hypothetical protein [Bradyrhizobium sp. AUGA SZCCT0182]